MEKLYARYHYMYFSKQGFYDKKKNITYKRFLQGL